MEKNQHGCEMIQLMQKDSIKTMMDERFIDRNKVIRCQFLAQCVQNV